MESDEMKEDRAKGQTIGAIWQLRRMLDRITSDLIDAADDVKDWTPNAWDLMSPADSRRMLTTRNLSNAIRGLEDANAELLAAFERLTE